MSPRPQLDPTAVAARRTAILEATIAEIVRRGPDAVRLKDVAAAAGVSVGTVQYYFANRDDLLLEALSSHSRSVIDAIERLARVDGSAWDRLRATFAAVPTVESYERRAIVWVELVAAARRNRILEQSVAEVFARWRAHFRSLIDLGIAEGSLTPQADTSLIVDTLIAQIDGFDLAIAAGREGLTPDQVSATLEATAAALLGVDSTAGARRP
ncbi:hypothetical protein GCM10009700_33930 [Brevibacterium sanguinis]|uniref:TetR/AcrR family transcriptional regulator n=1 Tax=Brevibacterium sanguinis TaxID=232444 RepID=UPI0031DFEE8A